MNATWMPWVKFLALVPVGIFIVLAKPCGFVMLLWFPIFWDLVGKVSLAVGHLAAHGCPIPFFPTHQQPGQLGLPACDLLSAGGQNTGLATSLGAKHLQMAEQAHWLGHLLLHGRHGLALHHLHGLHGIHSLLGGLHGLLERLGHGIPAGLHGLHLHGCNLGRCFSWTSLWLKMASAQQRFH